ncbi:MAG TPA: aminotransferase class I/II-fold pyridoxal phosphate-dependent enzyme [Firmicutes bacterium]|nr:aminotransferase class I/II-fold pyridoxal phosphate-dependent enzyme [Bacillota bacterium]
MKHPKLDQNRTPLVSALKTYSSTVRFHMPGHRGSNSAPAELLELIGERGVSYDVTGVLGLDDLHQPTGVLKEVQALIADAFGASESYMVVNGTSAAVHAMILSTVRPGKKILIPRNIHKSILSGIILSGAIPVFCTPEYDEYLGIAMGVSPEALETSIRRHGPVDAVLLVNPTYYGITTDLQKLCQIGHDSSATMIVDEAHGPHFRFHRALPPPALDCGADMCAHGMHKILGSLTQSSLLHVKGDRVERWRVQGALRLIQSTSPSYLLMASLDAARKQMVTQGYDLLEKALRMARELRNEVNEISGLVCFGREILGRPGVIDLDETKVTVSVKELGITGYQAEEYIRHKFNIQAEMSDLFNVLFIVSFANTEQDIKRLIEALKALSRESKAMSNKKVQSILKQASTIVLPPEPEFRMTPREAFFAPSERMPLEKAVGRVSAETVTCYPPGIPILYPGEVISDTEADYLRMVRATSLRVSGPEDTQLRWLRVVS